LRQFEQQSADAQPASPVREHFDEINRATDAGEKTRFKWLHGASVLVTLAHIGLAGYALTRFLPAA
jgi:hypothetical protein